MKLKELQNKPMNPTETEQQKKQKNLEKKIRILDSTGKIYKNIHLSRINPIQTLGASAAPWKVDRSLRPPPKSGERWRRFLVRESHCFGCSFENLFTVGREVPMSFQSHREAAVWLETLLYSRAPL